MPHVVIEGPVSPREIWDRFTPLQHRSGDEVIKIGPAYLAKEERTLLMEAVAAAAGYRQQFFLLVSRKGDSGITVRLESMTDPEKTDAVRRTVALVAHWILGLDDRGHVASTNIQDFLHQVAAG